MFFIDITMYYFFLYLHVSGVSCCLAIFSAKSVSVINFLVDKETKTENFLDI